MNRHPAQGPPRVLEIPIENADLIVCETCKGAAWFPGFRVYRVSRLLTGTPNDIYPRSPTIVCAACGLPMDEQIKTLKIQL